MELLNLISTLTQKRCAPTEYCAMSLPVNAQLCNVNTHCICTTSCTPLSARFSEAEEDRKLWEFLGNAVLRFAADVHPLHGDPGAMSAHNKTSGNVCLVEYNVERVAHLLPSYVKHVGDFISGDKYALAIPLLFHAPLGVVSIPCLHSRCCAWFGWHSSL